MKRFLGIAVLTVIILVVLAAAIAGCASKQVEPTPAAVAGVDGATLLQERCSVCHDTDRVTQARKTSAEWDTTVTRMVDKGAQLTDAEKLVLVDYLAATYAP